MRKNPEWTLTAIKAQKSIIVMSFEYSEYIISASEFNSIPRKPKHGAAYNFRIACYFYNRRRHQSHRTYKGILCKEPRWAWTFSSHWFVRTSVSWWQPWGPAREGSPGWSTWVHSQETPGHHAWTALWMKSERAHTIVRKYTERRRLNATTRIIYSFDINSSHSLCDQHKY